MTLILAITFAFAALAWMLKGVTRAGAVAGFVVTSILFLGGGPAMFGAVLLVFLMTFAATRLARKRKPELGLVERSGRDARQVLANLGCAALAVAFAQYSLWPLPLLVGSFAALAEAAADTVSSETGKALAGTARLITTGESVAAGTDGAISLAGTSFGLAAAAVIAIEATAAGFSHRTAWIIFTSGVAGMLLDSVLGATLEQRGWLNNNAVNLLSTAFAAAVATFVFRLV